MNTDQIIEDNCSVIDSLELSKRQRPGRMHNLDALCRRFEIDASARTVHGALLDAQILAQVYLAMTGGQSTLFSDSNVNIKSKENSNSFVRLSSEREDLKIVRASESELEAHNNYFSPS
jgi:DNA polymerase-3 subunit epsilon